MEVLEVGFCFGRKLPAPPRPTLTNDCVLKRGVVSVEVGMIAIVIGKGLEDTRCFMKLLEELKDDLRS